jgi:hypothetical protein
MILRTHVASPLRPHSSASQGLTLESWHIVGLLRLPLPVAGAQLALAEPNVSDQLRAIGAQGESFHLEVTPAISRELKFLLAATAQNLRKLAKLIPLPAPIFAT